jgi:crossover junction endodeoxyribonuclease RuvC
MTMIRAIGIDPGSRIMGYGIVESHGNRLCHVANGIIRMPSDMEFPERLKVIYSHLMQVIDESHVACMAVEDVFFAKNVKSALRLGHARGAAILAGVNAGLPIFEYSALQVKQAVVGYGRAGKDQVSQMIQYLFKLNDSIDPNAADALAVAICHLNTHSSKARWKVSE